MQQFGVRASAFSVLERVSRFGWTDETATQFEHQFGDDIRRLIVLYLWKLGLTAYRFDPARAHRILQTQCLELFENSLSDVWIALTRGLVKDYVRELANRSADSFPFQRYLAGAVRNTVIENARSLRLLPRESESALLRGLCAARRQGTQRAHLARAMYQLQTKAERELLSACPEEESDRVYENLYRLVHHFFEQYVPRQCPRIEKSRGSAIVAKLAEEYMAGEYRAGLEYTGTVTPWDPGAARRVLGHGEDGETDTDEEEFLTLLALRADKAR